MSSKSESSPKYSPVRDVLQDDAAASSLSGGGRKICTAPESTMYIDEPWSPLREDHLAGLERALGEALREGLAILVGQALEQRDLGEQIGVAHSIRMVARSRRRRNGDLR